MTVNSFNHLNKAISKWATHNIYEEKRNKQSIQTTSRLLIEMVKGATDGEKDIHIDT
jgi:hypothetical protein